MELDLWMSPTGDPAEADVASELFDVLASGGMIRHGWRLAVEDGEISGCFLSAEQVPVASSLRSLNCWIHLHSASPSGVKAVRLVEDGRRRIILIVRRALALSIAQLLLDSWYRVFSIDIPPKAHSLNDNANRIIQGGVAAPHDLLWSHGLTGSGQVIGFGDSGLDFQSCFFSDPDHPGLPANGVLEGNRRKLIFYKQIADDKDVEYGHGTHVGGTLAGKCVLDDGSWQGDYNGAAFDAKLAFVDIGKEGLDV